MIFIQKILTKYVFVVPLVQNDDEERLRNPPPPPCAAPLLSAQQL